MRLSFRKALLIYTLIPIALIFVAFSVENLTQIKNETRAQIVNHMMDLAISYAKIFDGFLKPIEGAAKTNAQFVEMNPHMTKEDIFQLLELQVAHNPNIYGAAIAFMPMQFDPSRRLVAPYVYRKKGKMKRIDIGEYGYDYTDSEWEWWNYTAATEKARWTEPYFDEGAGNILMSTHSVPFFRDGKLWGVATVDIPLQQINDNISIPGVKGRDITVLSSTGKIVLFSDTNQIGKSIFDFIDREFKRALSIRRKNDPKAIQAKHTEILTSIRSMLAGNTGMIDLTSLQDGEDYLYFFAPINSAKWGFSIRVKESDVFRSVYQRFWYSLLFFVLLLILVVLSVVLVAGKFSNALNWLIDRCQRIQRLNFQTVDEMHFKIDEVEQMSSTLNTMSKALDSHFSVRDDIRIARAIRQQALPSTIPQVSGFQIEIWNHFLDDGFNEIFDVTNVADIGTVQESNDSGSVGAAALLLLDNANRGIDASVQNIQLRAIFRTVARLGDNLEQIASRMNRFLFMDSPFDGPVQVWLGWLSSSQARLASLNLGNYTILKFSGISGQLQNIGQSACSLSVTRDLPLLVTQIVDLEEGDIIVVSSNDIIEALNKKREKFGIKSIERQLQKYWQSDARMILQTIKQEYLSFIKDAYVQRECSIIVIKRVSSLL